MDFMGMLNRAVAPIKQRIFLMIARGLVTAIRANPNGFQKVSLGLLADEDADGLDRYQEHGFASKPPKGSNALALFLAGNRSHGVVVCIDNVRYRFEGLDDGEVALYTEWDKGTEGHRIHFKKDRTIEVKASKMLVGGSTKAVVLDGDGVNIDLVAGNPDFYAWAVSLGCPSTSLSGTVSASSTKLEAE